jgi:chitodextrinase
MRRRFAVADWLKRCRLLLALILLILNHQTLALAGEAFLSWDANRESDLAGYRVYVGLLPGVYGAPIDVGRGTSWTVPNLNAGVTYYFAVTAYNTRGLESGYSNEASKTIPPLADLLAPLISSVTVSARTMNSATVTWGTDEPADTRIEYGTTATYGLSTPLATAPVTAHSQTLSNLLPGTVYHYRVLSRDAVGNLAASADHTLTTLSDTTAPTVPANVSGTALSSSQINLSWNASTDDVAVTGYRIYRNGSQVASSAAATYLDAGLAANTAYSYTVAATDAAGNLSAQSAAKIVTTLPLPPAVSQTAASGITATSATLSGLVNPSGAATSAWFEYGTTTAYGSSTPPVTLSTESPLSANLTGLTAGTPYHVRLVARNAGGTTMGPNTTFNTPAAAAPSSSNPITGYNLTQEPYAWVETPTALTTFSGDDNAIPLPLPFSFPFYGQSYQQLYVSTNGLITFGAANTSFTPQPVQNPVPPNGFIAPFWRDLYVGLRQVSIASSASEFVIAFNGVRDLCCSTTHTFEVILRPDGTILLQYGTITLNAPTTFGIENQDGSAGVPLLSVTSNSAFRLTPNAASSSSTPTADATPPVISGIGVGGITSSGATLSWSTDEPADTQVEYGTTTSYGASTAIVSTLLTSHSQSLTGLNPATLYHYRVKSRDTAGNLAVSADGTFTTLPPPPVVSTPAASNITAASVTLSGSVDPSGAATSAWFEYGTTPAYGSSTAPVSLSTMNTLSANLASLASSTTYHFRLVARNAGGTAFSPDGSFSTPAAALPPPAPAAGYSLTQEPSVWVEAPIALTTFSGDDNVTSLPLPFSFPFYGQRYQQLYVSTNGLITFGAANSAFIPQPIPSNAQPNGFIAPFWRDLYVGLRQISIASSDSEFVIAFNGVRDLCCSTPTHTFEVILRPDGTIILQYGAITMNVTTGIGIENQDGTKGVMLTGVGSNQAYKLTPVP